MDSKRFRPDLITTRSTCISRTASNTIAVLKPRIIRKLCRRSLQAQSSSFVHTGTHVWVVDLEGSGVGGILRIVRDFHKYDGEGVEFSVLIMLSGTSISQPTDSHSLKHSNLQNGKRKCYFQATQVHFCPVHTDTGKVVISFYGSQSSPARPSRTKIYVNYTSEIWFALQCKHITT